MTTLITGGCGFLGSALARQLSKDKLVVVLDDMSRGRKDRLDDLNVEIVEGDICDPDDVLYALKSVDTIIHCAMVQGTQYFTEHPKLTVKVGMGGILNLLDCIESLNSKPTFILVSSSEVYRPSDQEVPTDERIHLSVADAWEGRFSYGGAKIASELAVAAYAHAEILGRTIIARPHNLYGIDAGEEHVIPMLCRKLQRLEAPFHLQIQGSGLETRSFCHVDDCVEAFSILLKEGQHLNTYHIGNPEEVSINDLANRLAALHEMSIEIVATRLPNGSPTRRCPNIAKIRALGFEPKVSLDKGIPAVVDWYRAHPMDSYGQAR